MGQTQEFAESVGSQRCRSVNGHCDRRRAAGQHARTGLRGAGEAEVGVFRRLGCGQSLRSALENRFDRAACPSLTFQKRLFISPQLLALVRELHPWVFVLAPHRLGWRLEIGIGKIADRNAD